MVRQAGHNDNMHKQGHSAAIRKKILADNAARLYGFPPVAG
jgi:predicted TIM-barrel fold metal-dependent hydrolase